MKLFLLCLALSGCGTHCKNVFDQIAACPCGNSRRDPDPSHDDDGCAVIECEEDCSVDLSVPVDASEPDDAS